MAAKVTIFGRPGCHLCDQALAEVLGAIDGLAATVSQVNIETDEQLHRQYLERIPVITVGETLVSELDQFHSAGFAERLLGFVRNSY
ncbi:MAG: glutaredoxin family protein [Thermoleophilaceae bacterium]|nr:glutaredoxin family protein [Thermoleophilaceae bacterium]